MKQIFQHLTDGRIEIIDCPIPQPGRNELVLRSRVSLISAGTERMLLNFGRANLLEKARQQPSRVKDVIAKARTDGLLATVDAVRSKLSQPVALGYSSVGVVETIGSAVREFKIGDRVVSNGPHAEAVCAGRQLCARVPENVDDNAAAFTVVGSIGLQGIRLAQPTLGESFVVIGAGLIGLLTVQMLLANGCRVLAIDIDAEKLSLAAKFGAETCNPTSGEDPVARGIAFSGGIGADAVLVTAATQSNEPIAQAAKMCRKRGRVVLVGTAGLELDRGDFYEKELSFQVSCSYGPGRYDASYEQAGQDYPIGYVRWTEQRNFEAVLAMLSRGVIDVEPLISSEIPFMQAPEAYDRLAADSGALGLLLNYPSKESNMGSERIVALRSSTVARADAPIVSFIGAGNYASRVLIPNFKKSGAELRTLVTSKGTSGSIHGRSYGFAYSSTDVAAVLNDNMTNVIVVATRHGSHAALVGEAISAGKHVFVEKPLALNDTELDEIEKLWNSRPDNSSTHLMVGFNRRFAPQIVRMKSLVEPITDSKAIVITINAGAIPSGHWVHDPAEGGGRIVGEACHFIDLSRFLVGAPIIESKIFAMESEQRDTATIQLRFADGSTSSVHYLANGNQAYPKERVEVFCGGRILQLDNFRALRGWGWQNFSRERHWRQDKGHAACVEQFLAAVKHGTECPIPIDEVLEVSRISARLQSAIN